MSARTLKICGQCGMRFASQRDPLDGEETCPSCQREAEQPSAAIGREIEALRSRLTMREERIKELERALERSETDARHARTLADMYRTIADLRDPGAAESAGVGVEGRCRAIVARAPAVLLMKGTPDAPRCGFSARMVDLLRKCDVVFDSFDILSDEDVRQTVKRIFEWPTFPQLYVAGKLVGGLDVLTDMAEEGDLKGQLGL